MMRPQGTEQHESDRLPAPALSIETAAAEIRDQVVSATSPALFGRGRELTTVGGLVDAVCDRGVALVVLAFGLPRAGEMGEDLVVAC